MSNTGASAAVDGWFAAWSEPDAARREAMLDRLATEEVRFKDRFSLIDGLSDLRPHLAAVHRFMPGMRLEREGDVRHCQGTVLADWVARGADGQERGRGTNVFAIGHHGRIEAVTGFWGPAKSDVGRGFSPACQFLRSRVQDTRDRRISTTVDPARRWQPRGYNEPRDRQRRPPRPSPA